MIFLKEPGVGSLALPSDGPRSSQTFEELVGGIFMGGEEKILEVRARHGFRVRYVELDECELGAFVLSSLCINAEEQYIVPDPISLDFLRNRAPLMLPASGTMHPIAMTVKNVTRKTLRLRMRLVGEV